MSNSHLKQAFEHRIGKKDHESFIEVVTAFFNDALENNTVLVAFSVGRFPDGTIDAAPGILNLGGEKMFVVLSDLSYQEGLSAYSYKDMKASDLINLLNFCAEDMSGIIINPKSEYHCFLPTRDIIVNAKNFGIIK